MHCPDVLLRLPLLQNFLLTSSANADATDCHDKNRLQLTTEGHSGRKCTDLIQHSICDR